MKPLLFVVGLVAAGLVASSAAAEVLWISSTHYPTAEAAEANRAGPPPECLNEAGANGCVPALIAESGRDDAITWRPLWASADSTVTCVDSATAQFRVDCDAPDAARFLEAVAPIPMFGSCVANPSGNGMTCRGAAPERPYRPTPKS